MNNNPSSQKQMKFFTPCYQYIFLVMEWILCFCGFCTAVWGSVYMDLRLLISWEVELYSEFLYLIIYLFF